MTRILVTGGTGFIGQHLVAALVEQPNTAVTLLLRETYSQIDVNPLPPLLAARRPQFDVVYADLRHFQLTARAVKEARPDAVIHLAAAGVSDPFLGIETAIRHNLNGTINIVRACFETSATATKLITSRTPGESANLNVYAASKAAAWNFCRMFVQTHHWPILGAMIYQAYGPGQTATTLIPAAINAALNNRSFPMTNGQQKKDWIYVSDVVAGLLALLRTDLPLGSTVELGTGSTHSVASVAAQIFDLVGSKGELQIGVLPSRPGESQDQAANSALTNDLIHWKAAVSLQDGLIQTIAALRADKLKKN